MSDEGDTITVRQLIEVLATLPLDAPLRTEGCDCWGTVAGAKALEDGTIIIYRSDGEF